MTSVTPGGLERAGFLALATLVGVASAALLLAGTWPLTTMTWDVFLLLDGAWRLRHGQVPHADYSSPVGLLPQAIVATAMTLFGPGARALAQGPALLLPLVFLASWGIGRARLPPGLALLFSAMTTFLWLGPFPHGMLPEWTSYAMYYNRIGWSLFLLLALESALPPLEEGPHRPALDGAAAGVLVTLLLLTKPNYFVAGAALLALRPHPPARVFGAAAGFLATLTAARLAFGLDPLALAADTRQLARCFAFTDYLEGLRLIASTFHGLGLFLAVWTGILVAAWRAQAPEESASPRRVLAPSFVIAATGTAVLLANATRTSVPLVGLLFLVLTESLRRARWEETLPWARAARRAVTSLTFLIGGSAAVLDYGGFLAAMSWKNREAPALPAFHRVPTATLEDLTFRAPPAAGVTSPLTRILYDLEWVPAADAVTHAQPVNDGILLLLEKGAVEGTLVTLEFVDPFALAVNLVPAKGASLGTHHGRTLCPANLPAAERFLGDALWVMVPRGAWASTTAHFLEESYRPYLVQNFTAAGESRFWILLRRK